MQPLGPHRPDHAVLVGGEALFDLVAADDARTLGAHPGGGPFNTARAIARLGQNVSFLGRLSTDRFGAEHERLLAADGVGLEAVVRTGDPTMLALAETDAGGVASYRFYTESTAAAGLTPERALAALPPAVPILHVGTLGLALEPIGTALEAVVEELANRSLIAVDPNCRPEAAPGEDAYRARLARVLARAHLVKASEEDLQWFDPEREPVEAARALVALGPAAVVITRGPRGAVAVTSRGAQAIEAPAVDVVDTIGAGDAFGGAFLAWWRSHALGRDELADSARVVEATRFAAAVASLTCERAGASPPRADELG